MSRIIVVSNRLPFTVVRDADAWTFRESVGGLATGLSAYLESLGRDGGGAQEYLWIGWPGCTVGEGEREEIRRRALAEYNAVPVFLSEEEAEQFYQGFCNTTIWPLFHYFPEYTAYHQEYWLQYAAVNRAFCAAVAEVARPGDVIWIHDYHLMLLPRLLREALPGASIGFFLHIPFPTYELFRLLPAAWRQEILEGLLGADLVGFHTYDYQQYFLRCAHRILGCSHHMGQLLVHDRMVRTGTFPMGIDFDKYHHAARTPQSLAEQEHLRQSLKGEKIVLSIDRLDYTKGVLNRLQAFELLLEQHPEWCRNVTLVAVVVPSRIGVGYYETMKRQIEELIGKINGRFGTLSWIPIVYQYRALSLEPLVALYAVSDVALITPLRDGMNLIAKEYVAARGDATGVLILSEMAGAAKELGEALIINPNNREEIAAALLEALEMPVEAQIGRNTLMRRRLRRYTLEAWAGDFLGELAACRLAQKNVYPKLVTAPVRAAMADAYAKSGRRLLLLDYDGTLVRFSARPWEAKPSDAVRRLLCLLTKSPRNEVALVSGRRRTDMERWFGAMDLALAAEHGAWVKDRQSDWTPLFPVAEEWKSKLLPILERHADRLPGAYVEEKDSAIAWHYRAADPDHAQQMARELTDDLVAFTANIDVQVLQGNKVIEVRKAGVHKGLAGTRWINGGGHDFILALGDDWTDEDMFAALPADAFTIHVGRNHTQARYQLRDPHEVHGLLHLLAAQE
jgi:trehalose 6-phosphate synthase/phosphatase